MMTGKYVRSDDGADAKLPGAAFYRLWEQRASIWPPRGKVAGRHLCFVFILMFLPLVIDFGRLPARSSP